MDVASDTHMRQKRVASHRVATGMRKPLPCTGQGHPPSSSTTSLKDNSSEGRKSQEEQEEQILPLTRRFPKVIHHCQIAANDDLYHRLPFGSLALRAKMFLYKKRTGKMQGLSHIKCFQAPQQYGEGSEGPRSAGDAENTAKYETK